MSWTLPSSVAVSPARRRRPVCRSRPRVTVFERFAEPRPIGAGLLLQPTGLAVLRALGLADEAVDRGGKSRAREQDASRPPRVDVLCRRAFQDLGLGFIAARRSTCCTAGLSNHRRGRHWLGDCRRCAWLRDRQGGAAHGPFDLASSRTVRIRRSAATDAAGPRAALSGGLHLDDRAGHRRLGRHRPAAPARPRHDGDDGPAAGRPRRAARCSGACPSRRCCPASRST